MDFVKNVVDEGGSVFFLGCEGDLEMGLCGGRVDGDVVGVAESFAEEDCEAAF